MPCPSHHVLIILILPGEEYKLRSFSVCSFLRPRVMLSDTQTLCSSHKIFRIHTDTEPQAKL
jgi:hypothetical protein